MEHEATNNNITTAQTHPLQVSELNGNGNGNSGIVDQNAINIQSNSKKRTHNQQNWVKFDDEGNEGDVGSEYKHNNENVNRIDGNVTDGSTSDNIAQDTAIVTATKNQLPTLTQPTPAAANNSNTSVNARSSNERIQHEPQQIENTTLVQRSAAPMADLAPAVLKTESTHVNINASGKTQQQPHHSRHEQHQQLKNQKSKATIPLTPNSPTQHQQQLLQNNIKNESTNSAMQNSSLPSITVPVDTIPPMRTIELSTGRIREGFANGDVIVTLLPANTKWPWITPAIFRPELVPEELMAQGLTLTVEDYVNAMETLVNDYRFTVYNICYKRILVCWILFAFTVLLALLFSGLQGVALFSLGVGWLFLNAAAIFLCMWVKLRLSRGLEKCLARVNKQLLKHKILLVLDDRGRISCHKVNLCFLYFDSTQCVNFLNEFLEHSEQNGGEAINIGWEKKLDIDAADIIIQGSSPVRLTRKQAVAQALFLSYLQRWGKDFLRRRLDWTVQEAGVHETPRHLQSSICPCQYEEEVLRNKIKMHLQRKQCCGVNCIGCWL